ncbi:hypothetical protein EWM64_g1453 [Hericium alpestre]|uniref:Telomeric single stranded DNA binding POT1/Cdc13 domain-containing protein n=1 Tax=Hericium alpestre TaxID=135208 RepID=A0A4Z0A754_9AGAM|nr:hypothetical protein EWM64_g1453 [Hericium alpestre]
MKRPGEVHADKSTKRQRVSPEDSLFVTLRKVPDELKSDDSGGGFIAGKIFLLSPRLRQFTLEITRDQKSQKQAAPQHIDVGEGSTKWLDRLDLRVGDEVRISLKGVDVERLKKARAQGVLPVILRYNHGICVQLVSRRGAPQDAGRIWNIRTAKAAKPSKQQRPSELIKQGSNPDNFDWFNDTAPITAAHVAAADSDATTVKHANTSANSKASSTAGSRSSSSTNEKVRSRAGSDTNILQNPKASTSPPVVLSAAQDLASSRKRPPSPQAETRNLKPRRSPEVISREPEAPSIPAAQPSSRPHVDAPTTVAADAKVDADLPKVRTAPARQISKRARKRQLAERERQLEERERQMALEATPPVAGPSIAAPSPAPSVASTTATSPAQEVRTEAVPQDKKPVIEHEPETSDTSSNDPSPKHESEIGDPILRMKAGLRTEDGEYESLASLKPGRQVSVIGVVTSAQEITRSRNGDWKQTLTLLDSSNLEGYGGYLYRASAGVTVSCFTRKYAQWLPAPKEGDVILLRMIKSVDWNGAVMLKGYYDRMRWCIFDPSTGQPKPPALDNSPRSEGLDNGAGVTFSPFWDMLDPEAAHCAALAKWWQAVQDERVKTKGEQIQVGGGDVVNAGLSAGGRPRRQHRLIADVVPYMEPDGYFDCTVEILHGDYNSNDPYILHVTDFTANPALYQVEASWCPPNLATKALKFELWDGAAALGPTMKPGEYWSFGNARMITSKNGYAQAKFKEVRKAKKLEEDDAEYNHHLKALLERKKEWDKTNLSPNEFSHKLLSEAKAADFFCYTVEVLHSKYDQGGMSEIYVTDYTARDDLKSPPVEDWSRELAGRILKVELRDGHNEMAKQMPAGSFFTINNLKLQTKGGHPRLIGHLGGHDRLLDKLNPNSDNERLVALLKRKAQWKRGIDGAGSAQNHRRASTASAGGSRKGYSSIRQIEASEKCPGRFRLRARVFDFAPALKECSKPVCTKCDEMISKKHNACVKCNDTLKEHVCHCYHLFFRLEDEDGDKFVVGVDENWSDLAGLGPTDFEADSEALDALRERLLKYIGNVEEVHRGLEKEIHTAFHDFTIVSWPDGNRRAYELR